MREPRRVNLGWLVVFAVLAAFVVFDIADAGGTDVEQTQAVNQVTGDSLSTLNGSKSKSFALSGGDMDIRDCLATHSVLFGLWQGTHINPMCVADKMEQRGNFAGAAEMRCSTRKFKRVYGRGKACIEAVRLTALPVVVIAPAPAIDNDDEDEEWREEHTAMQIDYSARISALESQRQADSDNARRAAARANRAASEAEQAEADRKEYAQALYEELSEWN